MTFYLADELFAEHMESLMEPDPLDVIQGEAPSPAGLRFEHQMRISDTTFLAAIACYPCHKLPKSEALESE